MQKLSWKSIQEQFPKYAIKYAKEFKELFTKSGKSELSIEDIDKYLTQETSLTAYKIGGYTRYFNDTAGRVLGRVEVSDNGDSQCYDTGGSLLGMVIGGQTFAANGVLLSPQDILATLLVKEDRVQANKKASQECTGCDRHFNTKLVNNYNKAIYLCPNCIDKEKEIVEKLTQPINNQKNSFKNLVNWFKCASYYSEERSAKIIGDYIVELAEVYFEEESGRAYSHAEVKLWDKEGKGEFKFKTPTKTKRFNTLQEAKEMYNKINSKKDFNLLDGKQADMAETLFDIDTVDEVVNRLQVPFVRTYKSTLKQANRELYDFWTNIDNQDKVIYFSHVDALGDWLVGSQSYKDFKTLTYSILYIDVSKDRANKLAKDLSEITSNGIFWENPDISLKVSNKKQAFTVKQATEKQANEQLINPRMNVPESYSPLYEERIVRPEEWTSYSMEDIYEEDEEEQPSKYIPKKKQRGKYNLHEIVMTPEGRGRIVMKQVDYEPFSYTVALTGKDEITIVEEPQIQRLASINKHAKYSMEYFKNPLVIEKANKYGLTDIENEDLTVSGLIAKMYEWDEMEHGVPSYIYDMTKKNLESQSEIMPEDIRRIEGRRKFYTMASITKQSKRNDALYYATVDLEVWVDGDMIEYDDELIKIKNSNASEDEKIEQAKERVTEIVRDAVYKVQIPDTDSEVYINDVQIDTLDRDYKYDNIDYAALFSAVYEIPKEIDFRGYAGEPKQFTEDSIEYQLIDKLTDEEYESYDKQLRESGVDLSFKGEGMLLKKKGSKKSANTKEFWEMPREEFKQYLDIHLIPENWKEVMGDIINKMPYNTSIYITDLIKSPGKAYLAHPFIIQQALSEGKLIPAKVLADYPDLRKQVTKSAKSVGWLRDKFLNKIDKIADVAAEVNEEFKKEREDGEGRGISLIDYYTTGRYHEIEKPLSADAITKSQAEKLMEDLVYQFKTELFAIYNISSGAADNIVDEPKGVSMKDIEELEEAADKESAIEKEITYYPMDSISTGYPSTQYLKDIVEPVKQPEGKYLSY